MRKAAIDAPGRGGGDVLAELADALTAKRCAAKSMRETVEKVARRRGADFGEVLREAYTAACGREAECALMRPVEAAVARLVAERREVRCVDLGEGRPAVETVRLALPLNQSARTALGVAAALSPKWLTDELPGEVAAVLMDYCRGHVKLAGVFDVANQIAVAGLRPVAAECQPGDDLRLVEAPDFMAVADDADERGFHLFRDEGMERRLKY